MKYAIVRIGNTQLKIEEGKTYKVDHFDGKIDQVLLFVDGETVKIGEPALSDVPVKLADVENKKDKKVEIRRYKAKSRYRKKKGHRQPITSFKVVSIGEVAEIKKSKKEERLEKMSNNKAQMTNKTQNQK